MGKFTDMLRERLDKSLEKKALKERAKELDATLVGSEALADVYTKTYLNLIRHTAHGLDGLEFDMADEMIKPIMVESDVYVGTYHLEEETAEEYHHKIEKILERLGSEAQSIFGDKKDIHLIKGCRELHLLLKQFQVDNPLADEKGESEVYAD
jgi:mevalonate kinase|tara:strand:- start:448 stop:906 length:459 start_codon:yes stop_codon:yes gene_type:complete